jgi:hypothetical protein
MAEPTPPDVHPNSGTGSGMLAWFNWAIKQHELVENTAVALRTGAKRVLETDDAFFTADMRTVDVEEVIRRFRNKQRGTGFKEASVEEYARRFRQSIEMYVKWLADDPSWRPAARKVAPAKAAKNGGSAEAVQATSPAVAAVVPSQPTAITATVAPPAGVEMQVYPYPVRPGVMAQIVLPVDLTGKEAERVAKFVAALAFEERLAITAGPTAE